MDGYLGDADGLPSTPLEETTPGGIQEILWIFMDLKTKHTLLLITSLRPHWFEVEMRMIFPSSTSVDSHSSPAQKMHVCSMYTTQRKKQLP